jgi:hypothetical protein
LVVAHILQQVLAPQVQVRNPANISTSIQAQFAFREADLEAYEKGLTKEIVLVHAARERGNNAKTPEARALAAQDEWEDQTIPGGAQASGLSVERYRRIRKTVNHRVLETLDFQRKFNGPLEIDMGHAAPEMQRLSNDPFAELPTASAAALRSRTKALVPVWVECMRLTAINGYGRRD